MYLDRFHVDGRTAFVTGGSLALAGVMMQALLRNPLADPGVLGINAGASFARALASAPKDFDDVYRAVVAAGEQSGALGIVLEKMADDLEEQQALRAKLIGAALYPAIVSLVAVVIVFMSLGLIMGRMQVEFAAMLALLRNAIRLLG